MALARLVITILFVVILQNTGLANFEVDSIPQIINPDTLPVNYCSDSVLVSPRITVQNIAIDEASEGMKVSVVNYSRGEDVLVYDRIDGLVYNWNDAVGLLEIKGVAPSSKYQEALRKVYYKNKANIPNLQARSFSISLLDADYLPQTEHFYRYIRQNDIKWTEAKVIADTMTYYGLKGYLATITSSVENEFIWTKIDGIGWIGATDQDQEGKWIWATGPEAGTHFWQGTWSNGSNIGGNYSNWSPDEPNNAHAETNGGVGEDYAHISQSPDKPAKSWNDLRDAGDGSGSQYYRPRGFIVEFGGFAGEPQLQLSATAKINLAKIAFSDVREHTICAGEVKEINLKAPANINYSYSWLPAENISSVTVSNPLVNPLITTNYIAVGKLGFCTDTADFLVKVNALPVAQWSRADTICRGQLLTLDPGIHAAYQWENGATTQTISVGSEGWYKVELKNEFNCKTTDSSLVKWSVIPELDYSYFDTLVCGSKTDTLNLVFKNGNASTRLVSLQPGAIVKNENTLNPVVIVDLYGIYYFKITVTDKFDCVFQDTLKIEFHNQPTAKFQIDSMKCEGYNLNLTYGGTIYEEAMFKWYSNDTLYFSGLNSNSITIPLGYGSSNRSVGLKINEKGCTDSLRLPVTVKPVLDFSAGNNEGCTPLTTKFTYTASEKIEKFYWDFGDSTNSLAENPIHTFTNKESIDQKFDVSLKIVSAEGCENTGIKKEMIMVHPIPSVNFDFDENFCHGVNGTVTYSGSATDADQFLWDLTNFLPDEIIKIPETSKMPLEFSRISAPTVKIGLKIVSSFGCETPFFTKTWKRKPVFTSEIENPENCPPLKVKFSAATTDRIDDVTYHWDFGDGKAAQSDTASNIYLQPDSKYSIRLTAISKLTQCSDTLFLADTIVVFPVPVAGFDPQPPNVLISNPVVVFSNASRDAASFEWDFGDQSSLSDEQNPEHRYTGMGIFDVLLTAINDFGCIDTTAQQVTVTFDRLFPPNAFSPNAIEEEDREFRVYSPGIDSKGYLLLIYNRWGEIIFRSESQDYGWNGKVKNSHFAPAGVYTWIVQYTDFRGEKHKQQGTLTLVF